MDTSTLDSLFECLTERHRRVVLSYLLDSGGRSATVEELVDTLVEAESHSSSPNPDSVAITLILDRIHLPLLADTGLIEYDRDQGVVTTTGRTTEVDPYLDGEVTSEEEFHRELGELLASAQQRCLTWTGFDLGLSTHSQS